MKCMYFGCLVLVIIIIIVERIWRKEVVVVVSYDMVGRDWHQMMT